MNSSLSKVITSPRIAAGVILLAVLVFAALGVFLIYTQRIGETYNIIERSHSPADQTISIEAYPASLFNDDKTLIRMWRGRYYLADSGSDRTYVSFPLDENEEFGFFNWARKSVHHADPHANGSRRVRSRRYGLSAASLETLQGAIQRFAFLDMNLRHLYFPPSETSGLILDA